MVSVVLPHPLSLPPGKILKLQKGLSKIIWTLAYCQ